MKYIYFASIINHNFGYRPDPEIFANSSAALTYLAIHAGRTLKVGEVDLEGFGLPPSERYPFAFYKVRRQEVQGAFDLSDLTEAELENLSVAVDAQWARGVGKKV